jgi:hypothetical protein
VEILLFQRLFLPQLLDEHRVLQFHVGSLTFFVKFPQSAEDAIVR